MKKQKIPSFWKPMKIKPFVNLNSYPKRSVQEKRLINFSPWGDKDRDGTMNWFDCKPLNKRKHSKMLREEIEREVISPDDIRTTPKGRKMNITFPSVGELREEMKGHYGKEVPPKKRVRLLTKKHIVRVLERNPDLYSKIKKAGVKVEMKNYYDAIYADIGEGNRSLATYRPGYRKIQVNPIRDINDPTLLKTLKHEAAHAGQKFVANNIIESERDARMKANFPTAREAMKMLRRPRPETLKALELKRKRLIQEDDYERRRRLKAGYTQIKEIDAAEFKKEWEKKHKEKLDWNKLRLESAKKRGYDDSYPRIDSTRDVEDGRHRIAAAAKKGEKIDVAIKEPTTISSSDI